MCVCVCVCVYIYISFPFKDQLHWKCRPYSIYRHPLSVLNYSP